MTIFEFFGQLGRFQAFIILEIWDKSEKLKEFQQQF
jgi:hypothetical protein